MNFNQRKPNGLPGSRKSMHGFTMIEIMIAIVIMALGAVAVLYYQSRTQATQTANNIVTDVTMLVGKTRAAFRPTNSFALVSPTTISQYVPSPMQVSSGNLIDELGNTGAINGAASSFAIVVGGTTNPLTAEQCSIIATGLANSAVAINVGASGAATAASGAVSGGSAYKAAGGVPNPANLQTGCAATSPVVAMQFSS